MVEGLVNGIMGVFSGGSKDDWAQPPEEGGRWTSKRAAKKAAKKAAKQRANPQCH